MTFSKWYYPAPAFGRIKQKKKQKKTHTHKKKFVVPHTDWWSAECLTFCCSFSNAVINAWPKSMHKYFNIFRYINAHTVRIIMDAHTDWLLKSMPSGTFLTNTNCGNALAELIWKSKCDK